MEIRVAGHRLYGYKWCCQNKIIIVLIRKLFSIGPTLLLKPFQPLLCSVFHDTSCVFPTSGSVVYVLYNYCLAMWVPRILVQALQLQMDFFIDLILVLTRSWRLTKLVEHTLLSSRNGEKTSISYCTWNTLWYVLNIMTTASPAIIDSPTQPFSLWAVRFTNSTIF